MEVSSSNWSVLGITPITGAELEHIKFGLSVGNVGAPQYGDL